MHAVHPSPCAAARKRSADDSASAPQRKKRKSKDKKRKREGDEQSGREGDEQSGLSESLSDVEGSQNDGGDSDDSAISAVSYHAENTLKVCLCAESEAFSTIVICQGSGGTCERQFRGCCVEADGKNRCVCANLQYAIASNQCAIVSNGSRCCLWLLATTVVTTGNAPETGQN